METSRYMDGIFDLRSQHAQARVGFLGVPHEEVNMSGRPGSREAPWHIRRASRLLETYSPLLDVDIQEVGAVDLGDLVFTEYNSQNMQDGVKSRVTEMHQQGQAPVLIGGDNTCAVPLVSALLVQYPELMVFQLDAHANLGLEESGVPRQKTTMTQIRRQIPDAQRIVLYGIRAGQKQEIAKARESRVCGPFPSFDHQRLTALRYHLEAVHFRPIVVLCDLDVFDPALMPGVRHPEPGGVDYEEFRQMLYHLKGRNVVGAAVVGASLQSDANETSAVLAASVVRELGLLAALRPSGSPR